MTTRNSFHLSRDLLALIVLYGSARLVVANYIGAERPFCRECAVVSNYTGDTNGVSLTEGNRRDDVAITSLQSAFGPTINVTLTYNSYNADGSHALLDTVLGYGWTHSYNNLLFSQVGSIFRMDGEGRTAKFQAGPGGTYSADTGYFETLKKNPDGSFTITTKERTVYQYTIVPGTPFQVSGPVYRLQSVADRNNNTTILSYTGGNLTRITDAYGRFVVLSYNSSGHLVQVVDPSARTNSFSYDSTGRRLVKTTDPKGNTISYTYNILNQIVAKADRNGRLFTYQYQNNLPAGTKDANSDRVFELFNANYWATSFSALAMNQQRIYVPGLTRETDGRGSLWSYQYDERGYLRTNTAPDGSTTRYTYDPLTLRVATVTDPNNHTTSYTYDARGNRTNVTDALGHVTSFTYESLFSQMTSMTDPNLRTTIYQYDLRGNRTNEIDALGKIRSWTYDLHGNILSERDKRGNLTTYAYDSAGNRTNMTDALGNATRFTYDSIGNLTSWTDPNGRTTIFIYDALNRITDLVDALGRTNRMAYDNEGNRTNVTDKLGRITRYAYDLRNRRTNITDALSQTIAIRYDLNNNLTATKDQRGNTSSNTYDTRNRVVRMIDALNHSRTNVYDAADNLVFAIDANGHAASYGYDELNRRVATTNALGYVTRWEYESIGCSTCSGAELGSSLVTKMTDGNGKVTYFKYDGLNRRTQKIQKEGDTADVIDATDAVTQFFYDFDGNLVVNRDPNGNQVTYFCDALNRKTNFVNSAGDSTSMVYDGAGNMIGIIAPNGNFAANSYDALNRVTNVLDSIGLVARYTYDAVGNRLSHTDGTGATALYQYDSLDRLIRITDPLSHFSETTYDSVGNVIQVKDRENHTMSYGYDAINRKTNSVDALLQATSYLYDPEGNLTSVVDANGHATIYGYDGLNRVVAEIYPGPLPNTRMFTYDAINRTSRTDQKGQVTSYNYNDLYFLTSRSYTSDPSDNFTYDLSGRILAAERGGWNTSFSYDGANRVTNSVQNGQTVSYDYDIPAGIREITYPGGALIVEQLDARNRLSSISESGVPGDVVQYGYDLANHTVARSYRNGVLTTYSYTPTDWTTSVEHAAGLTRVVGFGYDYDNEGNKRFELKRHNLADSEAYQYDSNYRLTDFRIGTLIGSLIPVPVTETVYNLDPLGNWRTKTTDAIAQTRAHNEVNEITQIDAQLLQYDANGNLTNDGRYFFGYDEENRLTSIKRLADSQTVGMYVYDALNRRVDRLTNPGGTPAETRYFYDDLRVIEEQDGLGVTGAIYTYGNYVDEVLSMERTGRTYYFHQNALWSPEAITDETGAAVERYSYDAYGFPTITDGAGGAVAPNAWGVPHSAMRNVFLFTGRTFDEEAGRYFYRARYYDCLKGRFLQRDPLGYVNGLNLYWYVRDNPLRGLDPTGLDDIGCDAPATNSGACELECCAIHDYCFKINNCTAASWAMWAVYNLGPALAVAAPRGPAPPCVQCNNDVASCYTACTLNQRQASQTCPRYYVAEWGEFADLRGAPPYLGRPRLENLIRTGAKTPEEFRAWKARQLQEAKSPIVCQRERERERILSERAAERERILREREQQRQQILQQRR